MTTVDPDTLDRDPEILRDIGRRLAVAWRSTRMWPAAGRFASAMP